MAWNLNGDCCELALIERKSQAVHHVLAFIPAGLFRNPFSRITFIAFVWRKTHFKQKFSVDCIILPIFAKESHVDTKSHRSWDSFANMGSIQSYTFQTPIEIIKYNRGVNYNVILFQIS